MSHRFNPLLSLGGAAICLLLSSTLARAAAPTVSSFAPASAKLGAVITLTGTNFVGGGTTVTFNGVASTTVTVSSATKLTATVPLTTSTGKVTVKTAGGSGTSATVFTVVPGLIANALSGPPTAPRTLNYSGFGAREAVDVYFDTDDLALSSASAAGAGSLNITIPADAVPGMHWLTAIGRHSGVSAQVSYKVRTDYTGYAFNGRHTGYNFYENVLDRDNVKTLRESWRTAYYGGATNAPSVAVGVVYATFNDGTVRAFDEATGALKWTFQTAGSTMVATPMVNGGVVYVGATDNNFYALDAATGVKKWSFPTGNMIYSSAVVSGGLVYFGSYDDNVYALNAATGALVWKFTTGSGVYAAVAVAQGVIYATSDDSSLYALDAATGTKIWSYAAGARSNAAPAIVDGLVCFGSDDKSMRAIYASNGTQRWAYTTGSAIGGCPAVLGSTLYFGGVDRNVYALNSNGTVRWSTALNGFVVGPLCAANGVVYACDPGGTYALDSDTGAILTVLPAGGSFAGPAVVNGALYVCDATDGVLTRYALPAAQPSFETPRPEPSSLRPRDLPESPSAEEPAGR